MDESYVCDFCGTTIAWESSCHLHGHMWMCEDCGGYFCSKCSDELDGNHELDVNLNLEITNEDIDNLTPVLCPDCN